MNDRARALIVGFQGGVGRAVLSLLARSSAGRQLRERLDAVLLADSAPGGAASLLPDASALPPAAIGSADDLARLVRDHRITQVLDLSSLDTLDATQVCDASGADFLCTSVEEWPSRSLLPTDQAIARLLPPQHAGLTRGSYLVGSGANPGLVNALVWRGIEAFARRAGVEPSPRALDLHAVLVTEEDTTREPGVTPSSAVFAMTWSPEQCLAELFERRAFVVSRGRVVDLGHRPLARQYRARCANRLIAGYAVPHEELVTLARRLPGLELGFIYRLPPAARLALRAHPERDRAERWPTRRLYPPWTVNLDGRDRVGVLLCSRTFGELWIGFDTSMARARQFAANATQLQVAAGVLAGWSQLGNTRGIHFVEDLDVRAFVRTAASVLGPPVVVHDPDAPPLRLTDRLVSDRRPPQPLPLTEDGVRVM